MWSKFAQRPPQPPPPPPPSMAQQVVAKPSLSLSAPPSPNPKQDVDSDGVWGYDDGFLEEEDEQLFDDVNVDDENEIVLDNNDNNNCDSGANKFDADAGVIIPTTTTTTVAKVSSESVLKNQIGTTSAHTDQETVGWDDDDDDDDDDDTFLDDSITPLKLPIAAPSGSVLELEPTVEVEDRTTSSLGRVAENFGAALLASIDNEDNENDDRPSHGDGTTTTRGMGGFGGGFVMKGLSRFLEAATAPSHLKEVEENQYELNDAFDGEENVMNEGGWVDDDHDDALDFKEHFDAVDEQEMATLHCKVQSSLEADEAQNLDTTGDGWEDDNIDISFNSPQPQQQPRDDDDVGGSTLKDDVVDSDDISESIKDFVAMTEKTLDSKFTKGMWDTPPRNELRLGVRASPSLESPKQSEVAKATNTSSIAEEGEDAASKSLIAFVDNLDAELNEFTHDDVTSTIDENEPIEADSFSYNFENSKDDSPEPLLSQQETSSSLPRQESWYLNAMEDGKGGVMYGEEVVQNNLSENSQNLEGRIIPDTSSTDSTSIQRPTVGLPLSELPSSVESLPSSMAASGHGDNDHPYESFRKSEIQCDCLELIMPLPNGNENGASEEPGYGKKTLPDGTVVLVNYEKLLQNEATKRILLQRTVEKYEHNVETLQSRYQASIKAAHEQEIQLASSHVEITQLKELVLRLQDEKDDVITETKLFQAELAAVASDKEYLQQEVETIQQELKVKEDLCVKNVEHQKNLEKCLQEKDAEQASLIDQVMALQSSLSEVQSERDQLEKSIKSASNLTHSKSAVEIESLEQELLAQGYEIERLNDQINQAMMDKAVIKTLHDERDKLREENERLQLEMSETKPRLSMLKDENESLRSMHRDYEAQLSELKATAELIEYDSGESDKLAAEVASLTYELGVKSTECDESSSALQLLQAKFDRTEARLVEYEEKCIKLEEKLNAERKVHSRQVVDLQGAVSSLESQTTDLKRSLDERLSNIQRLESQIKSLNDSAFHHEELSDLKNSLEEKSAECIEFMSALQLLQSKFDDAEARLAAYAIIPNNEENCSELEQSLRAENCVLRNQVEDIRSACRVLEGEKSCLETTLHEHSNTIQSLEAQVQGLNAQLTSSSNLQDDLSKVRESLDKQVLECETMSNYCEQLKLELLNAKNERDVLITKSKETADDAREQISSLQSQIADLLKDQNVTMMNVEEQLSIALQHSSKLQAQSDEYKIKLEYAENERARASQIMSDAVAKHSEQMSIAEGELSAALQHVNTVKLQILAEEASKSALLQKRIDCMKEDEASMVNRYQELLAKYTTLEDEKAKITQVLESRVSAAEQQTSLLQQECAQLRTSLVSSQKLNADATHSISNLEEQLQSLKESNADLEGKLIEASFGAAGADWAEANESLRHENDELKKDLIALKEQINRFTSRLTNITEQNDLLIVERKALLSRVQTLEEELRAENLDELRDELTSLHTERQQLDLDNEELLVQLGLMQQDKVKTQAECEIEIDVLREEVAALQSRCSRLQNDLDESKRNSLLLGDEDKNDDKDLLRQTISLITRENQSLKDRINEITIELSGKTDQEVKKLRQELSLLSLKLSDKEEEVESTQKGMQYALDKRDLEIFKLTTENRSLMELSSKSDLDLQSIGNDSEEGKYYEGDDDEISLHNLLAETVLDSNDYLRNQVIILAQALERSEFQRADALERIFVERKSNEDSLRQLGESVKRFYSTVK